MVYVNPCKIGTPLTNDLIGSPITCDLNAKQGQTCPISHNCTAVPGSSTGVCCIKEIENEGKHINS